MNPEFTHGRPLGPEGQGNEAKREDLREFAAHRADRSSSSTLSGILTLAGAVLVFVATLFPRGMVSFMHGHLLYSIGSGLMWWGPVALLLVAGMLVLASGRLLQRAMAGGLAVGVAGVVLFYFVGYLFVGIDMGVTVSWNICAGLVGSAVALAGGLIALLPVRTKT